MLKKIVVFLLSLVLLTMSVCLYSCNDKNGKDNNSSYASSVNQTSEVTNESSLVTDETSDIFSDESDFDNATIGDETNGLSDLVSDIVSDVND
ncbi:MAG: hypothetical protein GX148_03345 [Clostridiales bacterium]|jgi:hypothetical protein|nr:hypothetical protein [Clostridiales bacterium]